MFFNRKMIGWHPFYVPLMYTLRWKGYFNNFTSHFLDEFHSFYKSPYGANFFTLNYTSDVQFKRMWILCCLCILSIVLEYTSKKKIVIFLECCGWGKFFPPNEDILIYALSIKKSSSIVLCALNIIKASYFSILFLEYILMNKTTKHFPIMCSKPRRLNYAIMFYHNLRI